MKHGKTLFYKGIGGFTRDRHIELLEEAASSPYRWWFEFLRCSKDYWWLCKQRGKSLDPNFNAVYSAFGNVFETDFANWFIKRGYSIFQEHIEPPKIEIAENVEGLMFNQSLLAGKLLLIVPLDISDKSLKSQFQKIISEVKGRQIRKGKADFSLLKVKGIRLKVLEVAHAVWCERFKQSLIQYGDASKTQHEAILDLYSIGEKCKVSPQHVRRAGEPLANRILKERVMRVAVIRMQKRAEALIANAEMGRFPSYESIKTKKRWTSAQQIALDKAVASGKWVAHGLSQIDWEHLRNRYYDEDIWLEEDFFG
jgi:hypothetical protein